jgi:hypothetical protein
VSDLDITRKIEDVMSRVLSRKYNAKIKIKFVSSEEKRNEQGRNDYRASRNDSYAGPRN